MFLKARLSDLKDLPISFYLGLSAGTGKLCVFGHLYPASRVSFDLPRQIGRSKETLLAG